MDLSLIVNVADNETSSMLDGTSLLPFINGHFPEASDSSGLRFLPEIISLRLSDHYVF
jgi:hypothetical protein